MARLYAIGSATVGESGPTNRQLELNSLTRCGKDSTPGNCHGMLPPTTYTYS